ncbi:unnamed protein product [Rotaria sordida]|uniref:Helix-turn-helix domain-containing protein n=1 Tax=Rotaria sordida TaxID=392033 RepID=A0A815VUG8_9BILA|nr:unnamed protein product [Rotaria sordida]
MLKYLVEIDSSVSFLDLHIKNQHENSITSVHHRPSAEPYTVPFKSDHPRHIFKIIIQGTLLRAIRYSLTLNEFNCE